MNCWWLEMFVQHTPSLPVSEVMLDKQHSLNLIVHDRRGGPGNSCLFHEHLADSCICQRVDEARGGRQAAWWAEQDCSGGGGGGGGNGKSCLSNLN